MAQRRSKVGQSYPTVMLLPSPLLRCPYTHYPHIFPAKTRDGEVLRNEFRERFLDEPVEGGGHRAVRVGRREVVATVLRHRRRERQARRRGVARGSCSRCGTASSAHAKNLRRGHGTSGAPPPPEREGRQDARRRADERAE